MRIVKADAIPDEKVSQFGADVVWWDRDTIEISDAEWDEIGEWWKAHNYGPLSGLLTALISLTGEGK